jgi:hypothetical protein
MFQHSGSPGTIWYPTDLSTLAGALWAQLVGTNPEDHIAIVKEMKFYRRQAQKAERMAHSISDIEAAQSFLALAQAYRSQADVLKKSRKDKKKVSAKAN